MSKRVKQAALEFERLTEPYHPRLFRLACSFCKSPDLASDLTQEALVKAFLAFDTFDNAQSIFPWLARILRNTYLDSLKTGRVRHEIAEHQLSSAANATVFSVADEPSLSSPLAQLEKAELQLWIQDELQALDEPHRSVLILCDMEELSYDEAAEILEVPIGTIRSRLARARQQLRERLIRKRDAPDQIKTKKDLYKINGT